LTRAGIKEILIIVSPEFAGHYLNLLGTGKDFGARFSFVVQPNPGGLAEAFLYGKDFVDDDDVTLILGDNIFDHNFSKQIKNFKGGAKIYAKEVHDPVRYGVVDFDDKMNALSIEEKPKKPKSNYAVVGLYTYDNRVVKFAENLKRSPRGELEITDLNNVYLKKGELSVDVIEGIWEDAGTFDSLLRAANLMADKAKTGSGK
jgi:glucose-1-phosphate thymidylyltransferase